MAARGAVLALPVVASASVQQGALTTLPSPLAHVIEFAQDFFAVQFPPKHDGLRWIEVKDPRSRKTDKLQWSRR